MIFATLDIEWFEDPAYFELRDADRSHPERFLRCVAWAKRFNEKGLIMRSDGAPMNARSMARIHDGPGAELVQVWQEFLDLAVEIGLLGFEDGIYWIQHWRRWHRPPSDEPDQVRERVARWREQQKEKMLQGPGNVVNVRSNEPVTVNNGLGTGCNEGRSDCNGCNDTEHSIAIAIAEHTPPLPPPPRNEVRDEGGEGPSVSISLIKAAKSAHSLISRGFPWNNKDTTKLREFIEAVAHLKPKESYLSAALTYAAEQLRWEMDVGKTDAKAPWALVCARAPGLLPTILAREDAIARHIKRGGSPDDVLPFKFKPEEAS